MPHASRFPAPNAGFPYLVFRTTPRDRYLAAMLFEHRVLTSEHIARLAFSTLRRANQRLAELTELGVVDRSRANPAVYGSSPYLYTLGPHGALLVAGERDKTLKELRYDRGVLLRQAVRRDLPHSLGCNRRDGPPRHPPPHRARHPVARLAGSAQLHAPVGRRLFAYLRPRGARRRLRGHLRRGEPDR